MAEPNFENNRYLQHLIDKTVPPLTDVTPTEAEDFGKRRDAFRDYCAQNPDGTVADYQSYLRSVTPTDEASARRFKGWCAAQTTRPLLAEEMQRQFGERGDRN